MINVDVIIHADENGNYPVKSVMNEIQKANAEFALGIVFPDKPLDATCIADLQLNSGEVCAHSFSKGTVWDNELCNYTERRLYLCFE